MIEEGVIEEGVIEEGVIDEGVIDEGVIEEVVIEVDAVIPVVDMTHYIANLCNTAANHIQTYTSLWSISTKCVVLIVCGLWLHTMLTSWVIYIPLTVGRVLLRHSK